MYFGGPAERMAKRSFNEDPNAEALKKVKGEDPEGSWTCPFCHNVNWPKRTTCNKEGCHMPREIGGSINHPEGSWACLQCNNINWPKRTECKKCRTSRQGNKLGLAPGVAGAQPGSWICPTCSNLNFPAALSVIKAVERQNPRQTCMDSPRWAPRWDKLVKWANSDKWANSSINSKWPD